MEQPKQPQPTPEQLQQKHNEAVAAMLQRQLRATETVAEQLTVANRMHDDCLRFNYADRQFSFWLPNASQEPSQLSMVMSGGFRGIPEMLAMTANMKDGTICVDVGAGVGNHTIWLAAHPKVASVYAFEPQHTLFPVLSRNISLNNLQDKVFAYEKALANADIKHVNIAGIPNGTPGADSGDVLMRPAENGPYVAVTLDSLELPRLDVLRIDVDGMQLEVLEGAEKTISKYHPVISLQMIPGPRPYAPGLFNAEHDLDKPKQLLCALEYDLRRGSPASYLATPR